MCTRNSPRVLIERQEKRRGHQIVVQQKAEMQKPAHRNQSSPPQTIVVAFTEDEAKEIRDIAERTRELAQQMLYNKTDMCSPCSPQGFLADLMEDDGNKIVTLSSRLLQLLRQQSSASSREV